MIDRPFGPGNSDGRITIPVNPNSALVSQAWLSASCEGTAHVDVWYKTRGSGLAESHFDISGPNEIWQQGGGIPAGTMMITYHVINATGPGSLLVELKAA